MALKDNLQRIRKDRKLSQPKLAELAGVSQQPIRAGRQARPLPETGPERPWGGPAPGLNSRPRLRRRLAG